MPTRTQLKKREAQDVIRDKARHRSITHEKVAEEDTKGGTKMRNLDVMLAQLCTLDKALEDKRKRGKKDKKHGSDASTQRAKKDHNKKKQKNESSLNHSSKKEKGKLRAHDGTYNEPQHVEVFRLPEDLTHQLDPTHLVQTDAIAPVSKIQSDKNAQQFISLTEHQTATDPANFADKEAADINTVPYADTLRKPHKKKCNSASPKVQVRKLLKDCPSSSTSQSGDNLDKFEKKIPKMAKTEKRGKKSARKAQKQTPAHDSAYEEDVLRSKISMMSFGNENEYNCGTRDAKKEESNNNSLRNATEASDSGCAAKCEVDPATKEGKMKSNTTVKGNLVGKGQQNTKQEDFHVSNISSIDSNDAKHDPNDISDIKSRDSVLDPMANVESTEYQSKFVGQVSASLNTPDSDSKKLESMHGSGPYSAPLENGKEDADGLRSSRPAENPQSHCRVIIVNSSDLRIPSTRKSSKKQSRSSSDAANDSRRHNKHSSSFREGSIAGSHNDEEDKKDRKAERRRKRQEKPDNLGSAKPSRTVKEKLDTAPASTRHGSKAAKDNGASRSTAERKHYREKHDRKINGYCYSSNKQHPDDQRRYQNHEKVRRRRNKNPTSSDDEHSRSPSKTKSKTTKSQYISKYSVKSQFNEVYDTNSKSESKHGWHRSFPDAVNKHYPEKPVVDDKWLKARKPTVTTTSKNDGVSTSKQTGKFHDKSKYKTTDELQKQNYPKSAKRQDAWNSAYKESTNKKIADSRNNNFISRGNRMTETSDWHTKVYDAPSTIRPELRESKVKHMQTPDAHDRKSRKNSDSASRRPIRTSVSTESLSSSYSSVSSSSHITSSSSSQSSSDHFSSDGRRDARDSTVHRRERYNSNEKPRTSSCDSSGWPDTKISSRKPTGRPRTQRSASSGSSFQRHPVNIDDCRRKAKPQRNNCEVISVKRYEANQRRNEDSGSPPSTQDERTFEPKFGNRRNRRPNGSMRAGDEDCHSLWQHHQLVLVSQKPQKTSNRMVVPNKTIQIKQPPILAKKPVINMNSGGIDKRSLTIRDLYSLHNVLSDTQNGTVISGYRRSDGLRVAIKRISKAGTTRWGWLGGKVVPLELSLLCQVNEVRCSGVVEIVEWHETTEAFLLVMVRPHPAVDLYDYVSKHKRIKETLARHIVRQLVTALQHCIKCGVLHRDVKLENILLNPETMEITLIDFGCGDYVRAGPYKEFAGTPEYYAPEWFLRKQYNGESMTVWSIGVLLYSLLCGSLPFRSSKEISEKDATKFPSDVSRGARDIIASLLQKNPRERLGLSAMLSHSWSSKSESRVSKSSSPT